MNLQFTSAQLHLCPQVSTRAEVLTVSKPESDACDIMAVRAAESTRGYDITAIMRAAAGGGADGISIISVTETGSVDTDGF